ncbi:hypothetical protein WJX81_004110 [Elliptochloris bilobata]|uniref:Metallo-beta-lactamase domain-containing protein n=1 Tax=Elliptochloris bilobata TaxID=381761 RepID=A0AAW1RX05_9CHLO
MKLNLQHARPAGQTEDKTSVRQPRPENVSGDFYVDHTCIDCDTCRWMAPDFFKRANEQSAVLAQPQTDEERLEAYKALLACPTFSIHSANKRPGELKAASNAFPSPVAGTSGVYHLGFHSQDSFGSASWLVQRERGNVMMDSPRFDAKLLARIKKMGGAKYMLLSHRDDVCDHAKWASALGLKRIIHKIEINEQQGTDKCEVLLEGKGPWKLPDSGDDMEIIFTPGHTAGHVCLFYKTQKVMFTGDHLAFRAVRPTEAKPFTSEDDKLSVFDKFNWYKVPLQVENAYKIGTKYDWLHLLPGHGRPGHFADEEQRLRAINALARHYNYEPQAAA